MKGRRLKGIVHIGRRLLQLTQRHTLALKAFRSALEVGRLREGADTLGRVPDVPHLDVGGGDGEEQA